MGTCAIAQAASLQVAPTSITLQGRENAEGLWLSNSGTAPVRVQLRVFRWTQADGQEQLSPTTDLVVSPPMQVLPPGGKQLVRLVRAQALPPPVETTYRVIVDELPDPNAPQEGLRFVLRYSVPIFVLPESSTVPAPLLRARVIAHGDSPAELEVSNAGRLHAQLADLSFADAQGTQATLIGGLVGYVLPSQTRRWTLPSPAARYGAGVFKARINGEAAEQPLPLAATDR